MIELVDTLPDINVQPAEYKRLLGYPRDHVLTGRERELAEQARGWYAVFKSRPSFRPLLTERMEVIQPPVHYAQVDG